MESWRTITTSFGFASVLIYAIGSVFWVSNNSDWYYSLNRPSWQPPGWAFGVIWPYNFIVLAISSLIISRRLSKKEVITWLLLFTMSIIAALLWSYLFYVPHHLLGSAIALPITALLTIPLTVITFRASIGCGLALIPYQIWIVLASSLGIGYALKN